MTTLFALTGHSLRVYPVINSRSLLASGLYDYHFYLWE
ncbi:hypothetical protein [Shigella phage ESh3]|nr:hypothetical protein [Shigella phage ESh3]